MAAKQAVLVDGIFITVANTPTPVYTSPTAAAPTNGLGTMITAFTAANGSSLSITYKAWVVPTGSSVGDEFLLVPNRTVKTLKTDVPYDIIGHLMPEDSILYIESGTANAAGFRVSGVELST